MDSWTKSQGKKAVPSPEVHGTSKTDATRHCFRPSSSSVRQRKLLGRRAVIFLLTGTPLYFMVKLWFHVDFPLNQSIVLVWSFGEVLLVALVSTVPSLSFSFHLGAAIPDSLRFSTQHSSLG